VPSLLSEKPTAAFWGVLLATTLNPPSGFPGKPSTQPPMTSPFHAKAQLLAFRGTIHSPCHVERPLRNFTIDVATSAGAFVSSSPSPLPRSCRAAFAGPFFISQIPPVGSGFFLTPNSVPRPPLRNRGLVNQTHKTSAVVAGCRSVFLSDFEQSFPVTFLGPFFFLWVTHFVSFF